MSLYLLGLSKGVSLYSIQDSDHIYLNQLDRIDLPSEKSLLRHDL